MRFDSPIFFMPTPVWRCYTGGLLLGKFHEKLSAPDSHQPEEWLASTLRALNGAHSQGPTEGLSRIRKEDDSPGELLLDVLKKNADKILGAKHVRRYGNGLGIFCKYLDSAVRLPIQCHPDAANAKEYYNSIYGKAEAWHILQTRKIKGDNAYIMLGFKPQVTAASFIAAVDANDTEAMLNAMHRVYVKPGETYHIPGRLPHAIGPGVLMMEIQEPTEWVVKIESKCDQTPLSEREMWGPLTRTQALSLLDYRGETEDDLLTRVRTNEAPLARLPDAEVFELLGKHHTSAFSLQRVEFKGKFVMPAPRSFYLAVVSSGTGKVNWASGSRNIRRGDFFLQPSNAGEVTCMAEDSMNLLLCLPPAP